MRLRAIEAFETLLVTGAGDFPEPYRFENLHVIAQISNELHLCKIKKSHHTQAHRHALQAREQDKIRSKVNQKLAYDTIAPI